MRRAPVCPGSCWILVLGIGLAVTGTSACRGQADVPPERLEKRNALAWEVVRLREAGQVREAVSAADRMLEVERALFGPKHEDVAGALEFAAGADMANGEFERASARLREALAISESALGPDHSLTIELKFALERS